MSSTNFQILTSASDRQARETLSIFEEARDFFLREQPSLAAPSPPADDHRIQQFQGVPALHAQRVGSGLFPGNAAGRLHRPQRTRASIACGSLSTNMCTCW
ncbi:MAG: hypothetical protein WDO73_31340 [Ignavibacteriota bacterium]